MNYLAAERMRTIRTPIRTLPYPICSVFKKEKNRKKKVVALP